MSGDLLQKDSSGNYELSALGIKTTAQTTLIRLAGHYLKAGLKRPDQEVSADIASLNRYANTNCEKPDDYIDKLAEIASVIHEPNVARFSSYVAQNFLPQLEKVKSQIMERELPRMRELYDNPFRTPSYNLLDALGAQFLNSPALKSDIGMSDIKPVLPVTPVLPEQSEEVIQVATVISPVAANPAPEPVALRPQPGILLLEALGSGFINAPALDTAGIVVRSQPGTETPAVPETPAVIPAVLDFRSPVMAGTAPVPTVMQAAPVPPPSERLLADLERDFMLASPLPLREILRRALPAKDSEGSETPDDAGVAVAAPAVMERSRPRRVLLRMYAEILQAVGRFTASGDRTGYTNWYQGLDADRKCLTQIISLQNRDQKGVPVDWTAELYTLAQRNASRPDILREMREDVMLYAGILQRMRKVISLAALPPAESSRFYASLLTLCEDGGLSEKPMLQKLAVLAAGNAAETIRKPLDELLAHCRERYGWPE